MAEQTHEYQATITWTGATAGGTTDYKTYSRAHEIRLPGGPVIPASADPHYLGDPTRANPEQLLVAALSACQMLTYLALAARGGVNVIGYEDSAEGVMQMQDKKMRVTHVRLRPHIKLASIADRENAATLVHLAHENCFIANSVRCEVALEPNIVTN